MNNYLEMGRTLTTDNFYTSVELAETLILQKTHLQGTLRKTRKGLPSAIKTKLKKGEIVVREKGGIVVGKWREKRDVCFLSTKNTGERVTVDQKKI